MFVEHLENRQLLSNSGLFNKDVIHLVANTTYHLSEPLRLRSGQKIVGPNVSQKHLPVLEYKKKGQSVIVIPDKVKNCWVSNVIVSSYKDQPAIRIAGMHHTFSNISATRKSGSVFIIEHANGVLIKDCNQTVPTQRGFVYGHRFWNLVIRNVTTSGNLYENEFRFMGFKGLALIDIRIDALNPSANDVHGVVHKANALRIHDGKNAWIKGLTCSGNVYFGVMDKDNGGLDSLKRHDMAEFKSKMAYTSEVIAEDVKIYGNLTLGTNLKFKIKNIGMVSWDRGTCITVNPQYGPFKGGLGLSRKVAQGTIEGLTAKFTSEPEPLKLNSMIKAFDRRVTINNEGKLISWVNTIKFVAAKFNKRVFK